MRTSADRSQFLLIDLAFIVILGGFVRLFPALANPFPLNDGGLFQVMIDDLSAAQYALPQYSSYSLGNIPFAYPPFSFYLAAFLKDALHLPTLPILQWLPALVSLLTIPAFWWLATQLLETPTQALYATLAFAFIPASFDWLIMGGGLTRAPGLLFALLTLGLLVRLYRTGRLRYLVGTTLFASLTVLTHPVMAWFTIMSALLFFLAFGRTRQGVVHSFLVALGVVVLTSPWWVTALGRYGLPVYLAAFGNKNPQAIGVSVLNLATLFKEPLLDILSVLALAGAFIALARKEFFLVVWGLVVLLVQRSFILLCVVMPFAMLAGVGLEALLGLMAGKMKLPARPPADAAAPDPAPGLFRNLSWLQRGFIGYVLIVSTMSALMLETNRSLTQPQIDSMAWAAAHTPPASRFIIISNAPFEGTDVQAEWFPALAQRPSLNTVQGYEWIGVSRQTALNRSLQNCYTQPAACLADWAREYGLAYDYVYVSRPEGALSPLIESLGADPGYQLVFENPAVKIFAVR